MHFYIAIIRTLSLVCSFSLEPESELMIAFLSCSVCKHSSPEELAAAILLFLFPPGYLFPPG